MALLPDFTISGDDTPLWSAPGPRGAIDKSWAGFNINSTTPNHGGQVWVKDTSLVAHGTNSVRVTCFHDSYGANTSANLDVALHVPDGHNASTPITQGSEEWFSCAFYFPSTYPGTATWCLLSEPFASVHSPNTIDTYGYGLEASNPAVFQMRFRTGKLPNPGSSDLNPILPPNGNGYNVVENILGTGAPRPFTKNIWHYFIFHLIYQATSNGTCVVWHREGSPGPFEKLYSNLNDGSALINRAPHPTWIWNAANGTPDSKGIFATKSMYRVYRGTSSGDTNHDVTYWCDGWFRRQSFQACLNEWAAQENTSAPTISSFAPTSGTAGVTSVAIAGTNFTGATLVTFNGVSAAFVIDSSIQITATVPATATSGKIQVTSLAGTGTSATDFTVGVTTPPVLPDPATGHLRIGKADIGTNTSGLTVNAKRVIRRTTGPGSLAIDKAYAYIVGSTSFHRIVVYDDDGVGGAPGTRLGFSDQATGVASGSWVEFNFSTPAQSGGDVIYIGLISGPNTAGEDQIGYEVVTAGLWYLIDSYSDGPSQPFGANYSQFNTEVSLVCDYTITGDVRPPLFLSASVSQTSLLMLYDEALDDMHTPDSSAFVVTVNQQSWPLVPMVSITGAQVQLTLANPVVFGDIVTVAYTPPGVNPLQDSFGNVCVALTAQAASNQTQPPQGARNINPAQRVAIARRIDPGDRRAGEGGGL